MEIRTKKELKFYILADRMMNRGCFKYSLARRLKNLLSPDYIMDYLEEMRKFSYYSEMGGVDYWLCIITINIANLAFCWASV